MRLRVPVALVFVALVVCAYLYWLASSASQAASSVGIANLAGLVLVFAGILAAGLVLRRASPPS